jgi:hypothetical protein
MNRIAQWLVLSALVPAPAWAAGVGTSYGLGDGGEIFDFGDLFGGRAGWVRRLPSLDLRFEPLIVQLYPLDFLVALSNEDILLTGTILVQAYDADIGDGWKGVIQPGALISVSDFDQFNLVLAGTSRFGAEKGQSGHLGVYVVPSLGLGIFDGEAELLAGGRLEFSVWFD